MHFVDSSIKMKTLLVHALMNTQRQTGLGALTAVKKEGVEAAEAKEKERQDAEAKAKEEAQKKIADAWSAGLGKADADVAAPEEPAGDHVTTTEPANAGETQVLVTLAMGFLYGEHIVCHRYPSKCSQQW